MAAFHINDKILSNSVPLVPAIDLSVLTFSCTNNFEERRNFNSLKVPCFFKDPETPRPLQPRQIRLELQSTTPLSPVQPSLRPSLHSRCILPLGCIPVKDPGFVRDVVSGEFSRMKFT